MDADDFFNFLFEGGGGGGGGGSLIADAFASATATDSMLLKSDPISAFAASTSMPILSEASTTSISNSNNISNNNSRNPFPPLMSLDTPVFESLTEDFFAGLLGGAGVEGGLETIDPDQLLSNCDASSSEDFLPPSSSTGVSTDASRFTFDRPSSSFSSSSSGYGSHNILLPTATTTLLSHVVDPALTPSEPSSSSSSPRSPPDHTYAGSDEGSGGGGGGGGGGYPQSRSPGNFSAAADPDAENTNSNNDNAATIFAPYLSGDETDSNVEMVADDDDRRQLRYTSLFGDVDVDEDDDADNDEDDEDDDDGNNDSDNNQVYVLEDDLAATEVVLTTVDDFGSNASSVSSNGAKAPILVKIVSSNQSFDQQFLPDNFQLDPSQVKALPHKQQQQQPQQPQQQQPQKPRSRPSSHAAKRSFITVKARPGGGGGGGGRGGSSSSASSTHSSAHSEELNFGVEKKVSTTTTTTSPQNYSRKQQQQQQQQRQYARKSDGGRRGGGGGGGGGAAGAGGEGKFPKLELTDEELRLLHQEGISLPDRLPLTKQEERALKGIRRKIRNKQSALASRQKKKTYVDNLESRVKMCSDENHRLLGRVAHLEAQNGSLFAQLKRLQAALQSANKPVHSSTCVMVLLLSFALLLFPNLSPLENSLPEDLKEMLKRGNAEETSGASLEGANAGKNTILPGQSRNLLAANGAAAAGVAAGAAERILDLEEVVKSVEKNFDVSSPRDEKGSGGGGGGGVGRDIGGVGRDIGGGGRDIVGGGRDIGGGGRDIGGVSRDIGGVGVLKAGVKRGPHESLKELDSLGYIIDDDIDDDADSAAPDVKRRRIQPPPLFAVESSVKKSPLANNETLSPGGKLGGGGGGDDDVVRLDDVKPDVDALDLVFRNNIKNLGLKTYENAYEASRIGRRLLTTETNIIDI